MGSAGRVPTDLPALATDPAFIFFTDFDGTITQQDSNDFITDHLGFGAQLRKQGNDDVLYGRRHFRDSFAEMMASITTPFDQCIELLLRNITLDPHFKAFYAWAKAANVPVVVLSGGMEPIIRALLGHLLGPEEAREIAIVSNNVAPHPGKSISDEAGWHIVFHDDSTFGHDKSLEIRKYSRLPVDERPFLFYAGDGVSDLSAARETDLMFAKTGQALVTYCKNENIPYTEFNDFSSIFATVKAIAESKIAAKKVARPEQ